MFCEHNCPTDATVSCVPSTCFSYKWPGGSWPSAVRDRHKAKEIYPSQQATANPTRDRGLFCFVRTSLVEKIPLNTHFYPMYLHRRTHICVFLYMTMFPLIHGERKRERNVEYILDDLQIPQLHTCVLMITQCRSIAFQHGRDDTLTTHGAPLMSHRSPAQVPITTSPIISKRFTKSAVWRLGAGCIVTWCDWMVG